MRVATSKLVPVRRLIIPSSVHCGGRRVDHICQRSDADDHLQSNFADAEAIDLSESDVILRTGQHNDFAKYLQVIIRRRRWMSSNPEPQKYLHTCKVTRGIQYARPSPSGRAITRMGREERVNGENHSTRNGIWPTTAARRRRRRAGRRLTNMRCG